ncbi:DUF2177 family protein [Glaciecola sp. MF2-115]|uniref:DUF2177 family protein n=1 Tax=Glaciecola sp. MF2-115 TaxID=3384827 RepID=UPI0039A1E292
MRDNIIRFLGSICASVFAILLTVGLLDLIWFTLISGDWYKTEMNGLLRENFILWPWLIFYLLYGCITFILAVVPNRDKPLYYAGIDGALLGLASYGAYNLTNYSILEGFSLLIMMIDWIWGVFLTSTSALSGWFAFQLMRKDK